MSEKLMERVYENIRDENEFWYLNELQEWCEECENPTQIVDVHDELVGYEEQSELVTAVDLKCGHSEISKTVTETHFRWMWE